MSFLALEVIGGTTFLGKGGYDAKIGIWVTAPEKETFFGGLYWLAKKRLCARVCSAFC